MSVVALALLVGGSGFAYWNYKQGRPHPVWVPLPINPDLSDEKREEIAMHLMKYVRKLLRAESRPPKDF